MNKEDIICNHCGKKFNDYKKNSRKFCSKSCANSFNNLNRGENSKCLNCNQILKKSKVLKYCSYSCAGEHKSLLLYQDFLTNNEKYCEVGYNPRSFKKHILKEQDFKCAICSIENYWKDKELIFILDHIDGNAYNNKRENLRCVCPNCDSQLDTYKSKNKKSGRFSRKERYKEGKSF